MVTMDRLAIRTLAALRISSHGISTRPSTRRPRNNAIARFAKLSLDQLA